MTAPPAYATAQQFAEHIRDPSGLDSAQIERNLLSASRKVERICGRHFYQTTETQYFSPRINDPWLLDLDDAEIATKSGLTVGVQWANGGNYSETRTVDVDFVLQPVNQSVNGIDGWPWTSMRSLAKLWPQRYGDVYRDTVRVTATFGWAAVPDPVVDATLMLAAELFKSGEAPFGVAGFGDMGVVRIRQDNPVAMGLLQPYRKQTTLLMA